MWHLGLLEWTMEFYQIGLLYLQIRQTFIKAYEEIKATLAQLYEFFAADSEEVQREWVRFTQKVILSCTFHVSVGWREHKRTTSLYTK